jgi:uncharacterized membrane protein
MRRVLGATFLVAGALHVLKPRTYEAIVPRYLPAPRALVLASGVAEMAMHAERFRRIPEPLLWARLPLQGAIIAWVWRVAIR